MTPELTFPRLFELLDRGEFLANAPIKDIVEIVGWAFAVASVAIALWRYWTAKVREQKDRDYGTYDALDDKYYEFTKLCFEHPKLDIFDLPDKAPGALTDTEAKQQLVAFSLLFQILERAYLMYEDRDSAESEEQWKGWELFIDRFSKRQNFRDAWDQLGAEWDPRFAKMMNEKIPVSRP